MAKFKFFKQQLEGRKQNRVKKVLKSFKKYRIRDKSVF